MTSWTTRIGLVLVAAVVLAGCQTPAFLYELRTFGDLPAVDPASVLVTCPAPGTIPVVTQTSHLDPSCSYEDGIEIRGSNLVLDCRGATIRSRAGEGGRGIAIATTTAVAQHDVTVRHCTTDGFTNGIRVTRDGFRSLPAGGEYASSSSDIVIEDSNVHESNGSGIFVDGYVTGVTMRRLQILDAGGVGVYLEAGSKDNVVESSSLIHNGYAEVTPEGVPITINGLNFRYQSTGREGIAVDGSRNNRISNNIISDNSAGGIFLYKNCGEYVHERPSTWWTRRYGADGNLIENNFITNGPNGVWIGSRMAENTKFMDCSDTPTINEPARAVYPDFAKDNVVRGNQIHDMTNAIRVEDDRNRIEGNLIKSAMSTSTGVLVGTKERTALLGDPVDSTVVVGNRAEIVGNDHPFEWIHQEVGTTFSGNTTNGAPASLTPGVQPTINIHLFVLSIWLAP